jgi:hypothetical protein
MIVPTSAKVGIARFIFKNPADRKIERGFCMLANLMALDLLSPQGGNMNRKELFELLGAPLNNFQWSWGAVRPDDGTVFLCVWGDEVHHHNGAEIVPLTGFVSLDKRPGHVTSLEFLYQVL